VLAMQTKGSTNGQVVPPGSVRRSLGIRADYALGIQVEHGTVVSEG
jgi:hypothetical protein